MTIKRHYILLLLFIAACLHLNAQDYSWKNFSQNLSLPPTALAEKVTFEGALFRKVQVFDSLTFKKQVSFQNTRFNDTTIFQNVKFLGPVNLYRTRFEKLCTIYNTVFSDSIFFYNTTFNGELSFFNSIFKKPVYLGYAIVNNQVDFKSARFDPKATLFFDHMFVNDVTEFYFDNTLLPDTIYFANVNTFKREIFLGAADFTDSTRYDYVHKKIRPVNICLYNTDVTHIHLDYIHFKLLLPDSLETPEKILAISDDQKAEVYERLLANFKANGQTDSYRLLDIEYQRFEWRHSWAGFLPCLPELWWNFGYDKELVFKWTIIFMLLFTLITYFFIHSLNTKIYPMERIPINGAWQRKFSLDDFWHRLWYAFYYTTNVFFRFSVKTENLEPKHKAGTFYIIVMYTAGLLCIAYMANFVLQK